ncbi:MAG: amidohydrolase family protein, partial [Pseudomonadales bacterium]|nr:amidohydrolase family protein [Pseudomonadales bacterium]
LSGNVSRLKTHDQTTQILNAELLDSDGKTRLTNATIEGSQFIETTSHANLAAGSTVIDAKGNLLIPGLHDHHTHMVAYAASLVSINCGPPDVVSEADLKSALRAQSGHLWLRGTGYHESVAGHLDRHWLDTWAPNRPIRIQHRSGRLWIFNSLGMQMIAKAALSLTPHERARLNSEDGRLYDVDELLGKLTRSDAPPVRLASRQLAAFGVTGVNDMTPSNNPETWHWFKELQACQDLLQKVRMSGRPALCGCHGTPLLSVGETKVHLHDSSLPDFDDFVSIIKKSHEKQRNVAVHCVTEVELVYTLSAFRSASALPGDRIEHASVIPPALIEQLYALGLNVVTQPNFVHERGDAYLKDIPSTEHTFLYRTNSLMLAGVPTAFGTDLPFGHPDPWAAMDAATKRTTSGGYRLNDAERITPESALNGFLGELSAPSSIRSIKPGAPADCCLLDAPWQVLRNDLSSSHVMMTFRDGELVYARD